MKITSLREVIIAITFSLVINDVSAGAAKASVVFNVGTSEVEGSLQLNQDNPSSVVKIKGTLKNLTPDSLHGFHVHQLGDVRDGCKSTGGHFNRKSKNHGAPGDKIRHAGDLGNIEPDSNGYANIDISDSQISLSGKTSIIGRAFVVHEKEDDLGKGGDEESTKTGNAGNRLKCGVIGLA